MALLLTIAAILVLVAVRLLVPPVPNLLKLGTSRWGKRSTITLCAISIIGAVLLMLISSR